MSKGKRRIDTGGGESLGQNAFDALKLGGLPAGKQGPGTDGAAKSAKKKPKARGRVDLAREKAGRGGKTVTVLRDFPSSIPLAELEALLLRLKRGCACGGTLKERTIELQGDVREKAAARLEAEGFRPVLAGG